MDDRRQVARAFAEKWAGRGEEKSDTHSFWLELLRDVVGVEDVTTNVRFEQRTLKHGWIDVVVPDAKTMVEQKSNYVDLDRPEMRQGQSVTPYEQAKSYADSLPNPQRPDTIIVCNFHEFRLHDLTSNTPQTPYASFTLDELPEQLGLLDFLLDPQKSRRIREEQVTVSAGRLVGRLYKLLADRYQDPEDAQARHSLNVIMVRLVFCLFAEDAGIFPRYAFYDYLDGVQTRNVRSSLKELFDWLDTKPEDRDPYASDQIKRFPYVNGGLFAPQDIVIPQFTDEIVDLLRNEISNGTDWSQISPTIFGGVFESTLNPETRRAGGMHYTSVENIHKVIDPLFLDDLTAELRGILDDHSVTERTRSNRLGRFQTKIAGLTFLDPACGSGNFLTETYISLRRLENRVLSELESGQTAIAFGEASPIKVGLHQFYGIEINDFAVSVAQTALWIAQLQSDIETQTIVTVLDDPLPLHDAGHIVLGNALQLDWDDVVPAREVDYIMGNPPFRGARFQTEEQKAELATVFAGARNVGNIDYVAAWFMKTARYMGARPIRAAFVATNSICQGEQVANIWSPIYDLGVRIDFAHDTFRWMSEASDAAAVFVVVVGFSKMGGPKRLFHYATVDSQPEKERPERLNAYLQDAPDVFVWSRSRPLCDVPAMGIGSQPIDDGNYLFTPSEKAEFLVKEPGAERFFHRWYGSQEFIKGIERWVLWLGEATPDDLMHMPESVKLVQQVKEFRLKSSRVQTKKAANRPQHFGTEIIPKGDSLLVPEVSSERRRYIPLGFMGSESLCSNLVRLIPDATLYHFGLLQSRVHNAWMRTVAGRLKSDYRYSAGVVYNNFVWPTVTPKQESEIAVLGQGVLDAREMYPTATIAQLYDPDNDWIYPKLVKAHEALDASVERVYGLEPGLDEKDIVAHLFELYAAATA